MKKIININLYGRVIPIEDAAYDGLQRYIESLRRYFAAEEGRDEIINDIESRIAELMNDKIKKGAPCITEADTDEIIAAMGRVEDFEAADRNETIGASENVSSASANYQKSDRKRFTGRLSRDVNDKFLGGVCSGIAAYMNVDPTVVRLLFAIITFGGFGLGFLLYILLWIILPARSLNTYVGKRFFRNPDDRIFGGVAGGLAAYFNKNAWTIRLIFAAPLVLNILFGALNGVFFAFHRDIFPNFFIGSFSGTFIITYIILWIVLPEAKSPYEKMEMRGEKVDVNTIRQNVQGGMENFGTKAKAWGEEVKSVAQNLNTRMGSFDRNMGKGFAQEAASAARNAGSGIGHGIGVIFKSFFLFIVGVTAFALFVVVLVFVFGGVARPVNTFLLDGFWQKASMWGLIIFFLAVPLIAIITWIIRRVMKVRSQNRYLGWTFGGLWALGWICLPLFITSMVKDFRFTERADTPVVLSQPAINKLLVQVPQKAIRYSGNFAWMNVDENETGWDLTDDSLKLSNIRINVKQSEDSLYHVNLFKYSAADNRNKALQRAENISYSVISVDSVLQLGSGFGLGNGDKFRGQKVMVEIKIPVGKQIRFDNSVADKLSPFNVRVGEFESFSRRRNWNRRNYNFDWDNNHFYEWEPDTDYYMTADGKLKAVGVPDTEKESVPSNKRDSLYKKILDSIQKTREAETFLQHTNNSNIQQGEIIERFPTPVSMPFIPTIF